MLLVFRQHKILPLPVLPEKSGLSRDWVASSYHDDSYKNINHETCGYPITRNCFLKARREIACLIRMLMIVALNSLCRCPVCSASLLSALRQTSPGWTQSILTMTDQKHQNIRVLAFAFYGV